MIHAVAAERARLSADHALPALLLTLTGVSGVVDAFSFLRLGHVFVANMTGNVVFIGFALGGSADVSALASLVAIASFLLGGFGSGWIIARRREGNARLLLIAASVEFGLVTVAAAITLWAGSNAVAGGWRYLLIVMLGATMGVQNAYARRVAYPDLTTTVLTMTLTGIAADSLLFPHPGPPLVRRLLAVAAMILGATISALLVLRISLFAALAFAALLLAATALGAARIRARN